MTGFLLLGYGIHLARTEHWRGLRIGEIEPKSPAESAGLLREDVVLAINGHPIENDDFFDILSFIQHELQKDQIRFLVLDPNSADFARHYHMNINENHKNCIRLQTPVSTVDPKKLLLDQWRLANNNYERVIADETIPDSPIDPPRTKQDDRVNEKAVPPQPCKFGNCLYIRQISHSACLAANKDSTAPDTRLCSVCLRPGVDSIGLGLQFDKEFGHRIKHVENNSPAERAGIRENDCILSVNNKPLLHLPYEEVLTCLKKSRDEVQLDFLVANKRQLLQSSQHKSTASEPPTARTEQTRGRLLVEIDQQPRNSGTATLDRPSRDRRNEQVHDHPSAPEEFGGQRPGEPWWSHFVDKA